MLCKCCELSPKRDFDKYETELKIDKILKRNKNRKYINRFDQLDLFSKFKNQVPDKPTKVKHHNDLRLRSVSCIEKLNLSRNQPTKADQSPEHKQFKEEFYKHNTLAKRDLHVSKPTTIISHIDASFLHTGKSHNSIFVYHNKEYYVDFVSTSEQNSQVFPEEEELPPDNNFKVDKKYLRPDELNFRFTKRGILLALNEHLSESLYDKHLSFKESNKNYSLTLQTKESKFGNHKVALSEVRFNFGKNLDEKNSKGLISMIKLLFQDPKKRVKWDKSIDKFEILNSFNNYRIEHLKYLQDESPCNLIQKTITFTCDDVLYLFSSSLPKDCEYSYNFYNSKCNVLKSFVSSYYKSRKIDSSSRNLEYKKGDNKNNRSSYTRINSHNRTQDSDSQKQILSNNYLSVVKFACANEFLLYTKITDCDINVSPANLG